MSTTKRRIPSCILIGLALVVFPALIRSQNSTVSRSSFTMQLASSASSPIMVKSTSGSVFIGPSQNGDTRVESGLYIIVVERGSTLAVGEAKEPPLVYALRPNYPNPFNPATTIQFELPISTPVSLVVFDLLGHEVIRLIDRYQEPGYCQVLWRGTDANGREIPAGIYVARLVTPEFVKSIKMVLLK